MTLIKLGVVKKIRALIKKEDGTMKDQLNNGKTIYRRKIPVALPVTETTTEQTRSEEEVLDGIREETNHVLQIVEQGYTETMVKPETEKKNVPEKMIFPDATWGLKKPIVKPKAQKEIMDEREINYTHSVETYIATRKGVYYFNSRYTPCFD